MTVVRHIGCLKEAFHTSGDPISYLHTKYGKGILIGNRDMPAKLLWKQRLLAAEFYFRFQFRHVSIEVADTGDYANRAIH